MNIKFAGFIITYERSDILRETIHKVFSQTLPPQKILIIDNSESDCTRLLVASIGDSRLDYYKVGYNAGPAGAAHIGLKILATEGYDWIYWGDDNDPPKFAECFATLLNAAELDDQIGALGAVGSNFNSFYGLLTACKITNEPFIKVDSIGGDRCLIVNAVAIRDGINVSKELFFGFEELDLCIKLKKAGYSLYTHKSLMLKYWEADKSTQRGEKKGRLFLGGPERFTRDYYSLRNLLMIFLKNKYYMAVFLLLLRKLFKAYFNLVFNCGNNAIYYCHLVHLGIADFLKGIFGKTLSLQQNVSDGRKDVKSREMGIGN